MIWKIKSEPQIKSVFIQLTNDLNPYVDWKGKGKKRVWGQNIKFSSDFDIVNNFTYWNMLHVKSMRVGSYVISTCKTFW